jgi:hypothetical protein
MESVISPYDDITPYISVLAVTRRMCIAYIQPFFSDDMKYWQKGK